MIRTAIIVAILAKSSYFLVTIRTATRVAVFMITVFIRSVTMGAVLLRVN